MKYARKKKGIDGISHFDNADLNALFFVSHWKRTCFIGLEDQDM